MADCPLIVLFQHEGSDGSDHGTIADDTGAALDFPGQPFERI
jgi:hypothetical protein